LTRFTRFMGELCRAESSSELQPHLSSSTRIFLRDYAIFTITFDAYQLFLINKQLISLGRQVVRSKRILTVLLDERRGEESMRYELWARDHGDTNGLHWILTAASVGPSTFLHLEKARNSSGVPAGDPSSPVTLEREILRRTGLDLFLRTFVF
jgi:hypothetical protein